MNNVKIIGKIAYIKTDMLIIAINDNSDITMVDCVVLNNILRKDLKLGDTVEIRGSLVNKDDNLVVNVKKMYKRGRCHK